MNFLPLQVDIAVCGAGPAGLVACLDLLRAKPGLQVVLLDKRDPWREPVSCAEAVSRQGLHRLVEVDPRWVRSSVDGVFFVSPNGTRIKYDQVGSGLIIDRALMHADLAERCARAGAQLNFRAEVQDIQTDSQGVLLRVRTQEGEKFLRCKACVDATGAGGRTTRTWENLENGRYDLESAVFSIVENVPHVSSHIELWFGSRFFPGGYGWVFPRNGTSANVGLVVGRGMLPLGATPRKLLQEWVQVQWPGVQLTSIFGGAIACGQSHLPIAAGGVFKAGDSASMVNPISRAGIIESMKAGASVARHIVRFLNSAETEHAAIYRSYQSEWMRIQGDSHWRLAQAKPLFGRIDDGVFDRAAMRISRIPVAKRSMFRIFYSTLISSPSLLWKMRSLMGNSLKLFK